jgi:predicted DNA repair protein MutK
MPSGLAALLDDVATIAKIAASSIDDVAAAAGKASTKAAGVVIDDTAVTPQYVTGFTPDRELPIIWRIAKGSLVNKLVFILPAALLLSYFAPWAITPHIDDRWCLSVLRGRGKGPRKTSATHDGEEKRWPRNSPN